MPELSYDKPNKAARLNGPTRRGCAFGHNIPLPLTLTWLPVKTCVRIAIAGVVGRCRAGCKPAALCRRPAGVDRGSDPGRGSGRRRPRALGADRRPGHRCRGRRLRFCDLRLDPGFRAAHRRAPASTWTTAWRSRSARQRFDAGSVVPGLTLGQDIVGLKVRLAGDAVFEPDRWLPQIAARRAVEAHPGFRCRFRAPSARRAARMSICTSRRPRLYFAALAGRNVIVDATLRRTRANQFGLLGFGGDGSGYTLGPGSFRRRVAER